MDWLNNDLVTQISSRKTTHKAILIHICDNITVNVYITNKDKLKMRLKIENINVNININKPLILMIWRIYIIYPH